MVANNFDMFDKEQVSENEARNFAKEINAIFKIVYSNGNGIDELFQCIGKKFLNLNWNQENEHKNEDQDEDSYKKRKAHIRKKKECVIF